MDGNDQELELLKQLVKWSREGALPNVQKRLDAALDTETKLRVYHALRDGTLTPRKLEDAGLGVRRETAQKLVDEWVAVGLVDAGSNPPRATFTLAELGIPAPAVKTPRATKTAK